MKKRKLVRGELFGYNSMEFYLHEGENVMWWNDDEDDYWVGDGDGWGGDVFGNLPCGCCSCCGCSCDIDMMEEDKE